MSAPASACEAPPLLQRAKGAGRIVMGARGLKALEQSGCCRLRLLRGGEAEAVMINTAGGLTGGDALSLTAEAEAGARLRLTGQAAEKIYGARPGEDPARVELRLNAGPGARLEWLPQETILFNGARLERRLEAEIAPDACLLVAEAAVLGREAMGETLASCRINDQWRLRRGGRLIYAEALRIDDPADLAAPAALKGARAFASVVFIAPEAESALAPLRAALEGAPCAAGASAWNGILAARLIAPDAFALRRALAPVLAVLCGGAPRIWSF